MLRTVKPVNLKEYPDSSMILNTDTIVTGDLHANAIRLLYFLIYNDVFDLDPEDYQAFIKIYDKNIDRFSKEDIENFQDIIRRIKIQNKPKILIIGDETADRHHDYPILQILELLAKNNVPLEILISNHGLDFIFAYERYLKTKDIREFKPTILIEHADSIKRLRDLLERNIIQIDDVMKIIETVYKPALRFLSYSFIEGKKTGILIYSHAPIDLEVIKFLAAKLQVFYQDKTVLQLAKTIDNINRAFQIYVQQNKVTTLFDQKILWDFYERARSTNYRPQDCPTEFTIWNRDYYILNDNALHNGFPTYFAHGHTRDSLENVHHQRKENVFNLDTQLGKEPGWLYEEMYIDLHILKFPVEQLIKEFPPSLNNKEDYVLKDPHKLPQKWQVSQLIGRAVVLMLNIDPIGFSAAETLQQKNIANISFSKDDFLQIKIPLPKNAKEEQVHRFAEYFVIALNNSKYQTATYKKIDETLKDTRYKAQIDIAPEELIRFVLQCGCSFTDLINLAQNFNLKIDIEPIKQYVIIYKMLNDPIYFEAKYLGFIGKKIPESIENMLSIYNGCRHLASDPNEIVNITLSRIKEYLYTEKKDSKAVKNLRVNIQLLLGMNPQLVQIVLDGKKH